LIKAGASWTGAKISAVRKTTAIRPKVQGTKGCAVMERGQRSGVPVRLASTGASNARDSESICKTQQENAHPTSVMKRYNTAKSWIVRWQFRGSEMFRAARSPDARGTRFSP
jgi:hypothetical protein